MTNVEVSIRRQVPSNRRGSLWYAFPRLVIKGVDNGLSRGSVSVLVSPIGKRLNRFRRCMHGLREEAQVGDNDRLQGLVGCKGCPVANTYADGALPQQFFVGNELTTFDNVSRWITVDSCPGILALLNMIDEELITKQFAVSKLFSEAPCINKVQRFAKVDVSEMI